MRFLQTVSPEKANRDQGAISPSNRPLQESRLSRHAAKPRKQRGYLGRERSELKYWRWLAGEPGFPAKVFRPPHKHLKWLVKSDHRSSCKTKLSYTPGGQSCKTIPKRSY